MTRTIKSLRKRIQRIEGQTPGPPVEVRLIWYDPDSDPDNPDISYDSETETFYEDGEPLPELP